MLSKSEIQAARGLGILLVVFGHIWAAIPSPYVVSPYYFHMPLFFFLSGLSLRTDQPVTYFKKDVSSLLGYTILHVGLLAAVTEIFNFAFSTNLRTTSPLDWRTWLLWPFTTNMNNVQPFVIGWFLLALFYSRTLCTFIVRKAGSSSTKLFATAALLSFLGMDIFPVWFRHNPDYMSLNLCAQTTTASMFMLIGLLAQRHIHLGATFGRLAALSYFVLLALSLTGIPPLAMYDSKYFGGFVFCTATAFAGITLCIGASRLLAENQAILLCGIYSRSILTWHLLIFALVGVVVTNDPHECGFR